SVLAVRRQEFRPGVIRTGRIEEHRLRQGRHGRGRMRGASGHEAHHRGEQMMAAMALAGRRYGAARRLAVVVLMALVGMSVFAADNPNNKGAAQGALLPRDSTDARVFRGGLVYANYCVTCH